MIENLKNLNLAEVVVFGVIAFVIFLVLGWSNLSQDDTSYKIGFVIGVLIASMLLGFIIEIIITLLGLNK